MAKRSESDLGARVVAYMRDLGWDVWQEVKPNRHTDHRVDAVGKRGDLVWAVEIKTSLGFRVVEQAHGWIGAANYVSVAAPRPSSDFAIKVCTDYGIGVLCAGWVGAVAEAVAPKLWRKRTETLARCLTAERRIVGEAGSAGGEYWTPFRKTCRAVCEAVRARPGETLREIVASVATHYRTPGTARSSLAKWIEQGALAGVRSEVGTDRKLRLYPVDARPP